MNWQSIETAPKDGTKILAAVEGDTPIIVAWSANEYPGQTPHWSSVWDGQPLDSLGMVATHWMPLPNPPPHRHGI